MIAIDDILAKGVALNDHLPVNIYKGNTKVAGWHPQTVIGEGTVSLDGAYNVPPEALVIDGKCVQTGTPSPSTPAPITPITGDLTITAANGDLSDTVATPLGSVELCSLPDGTEDTYDAVTGVVTKRVGKVVLDGSADEGWVAGGTNTVDVKRYGVIMPDLEQSADPARLSPLSCSHFQTRSPKETYRRMEGISNNINGHMLYIFCAAINGADETPWCAWLAANPITVYYKLAEPYTIQLTPDLPVVRTGIKTLSVSANITPSFTATVKAMD